MDLFDSDALAELSRTRRDLHAHPELAFAEQRTSGLVCERLRRAGLTPRQGIAGTGVVATLTGSGPGRRLVLRAEMDALPLQETANVAFRSTTDGVTHACGHDAHTAILLTVADALSSRRNDFAGTVQFIFQPAEEVGLGAARMLESIPDLITADDAVLALHMHAHIPAGIVGVCRGPAAAVASRFTITVNGDGGHGAFPEESADPIIAAVNIVAGLQTIIPRELSSQERAVLSVCQINSGTAFNIIPDQALIAGTMRTNSPHAQQLLTRRAGDIAVSLATAFRCSAEFVLDELVPQVINDREMEALVRRAAEQVVGSAGVITADPVMAADDLAFFMQPASGCYVFLGAAYTDGRPQTPHHSSSWDIDERSLKIGAELMLRASLEYLRPALGSES